MTGPVPRHWMVASYSPPSDPTDADDHGTLGQADGVVYTDVEAAKQACRTLAANHPTAIYVVYEAEWWARVDMTPVNLWRVGLTTIG